MYFSKVMINPAELIKDETIYKFSDMSDHKIVWRLFQNGSNLNRDFIFYSIDPVFGREKSYYVVSERAPVSSDRWLQVDVKEYNPVFHKGDKLFYRTRLNPVIAKKNEASKNSKKHDVCMNAKLQGKKLGLKQTELEEFIKEKAIEWLKIRALKNGFKIFDENISVSRYLQVELARRGKSRMKFSTIDYEGTLEITDSDTFKEVALKGLGRSKGFGCGLFLLKKL